MPGAPVCCVFGKPVQQEASVQAVKSLQNHVLYVLGAEPLDRWAVEVTYRLKQKKKKGMGSEMKFGMNVAAPFVGMKRDEGSNYRFAKQYCIRRSDRAGRVVVVQEMADEAKVPSEKYGRREWHEDLSEPTLRSSSTGGSKATPGSDSHSEGAPRETGRAERVADVLEGPEGLDTSLAPNAGFVTRLKATVDGQEYRLGDYVIRIGSCRKGAVYRGLALEVEYTPCWRVEDGLAMIQALLPTIDEEAAFTSTSNLLDRNIFGPSQHYTVQHTALQTMDLFNTLFA